MGSEGMSGRSRGSLEGWTEEKKAEPKNSWDCSSPTSPEKSWRKKSNDWDSSSECQETMVEPFDHSKDCDNWDSESDKKGGSSSSSGGRKRCDSLDLPVEDLSDVGRSSTVEKVKVMSERKEREDEQDILLVEDLEEFCKNGNRRNGQQSPEIKVRSNHSEGTPEDTIWMIPTSDRNQSADSTSKLISSSDRETQISIKKAKSSSDLGKCKSKRKGARLHRSDYLGLLEDEKTKHVLPKCEGPSPRRKLEINSKNTKGGISDCESFDRTSIFFTEYECRPITIDKNKPDKLCSSSRNLVSRGEAFSESCSVAIEDTPRNSGGMNDGESRTNEQGRCEVVLAGPSMGATMDVVSLPDMIGRNAFKEREEKGGRRVNSPGKGKNEATVGSTAGEKHMRESWFLLDETGQYQSVTKNEVNILLNGRSADAVLQGRKEHFITKSSFSNSATPQTSLSGMLTKESLQHLLMEEDVGGENRGKKLIDLERKMENTLLYIRSAMNLTASVRIIPVDTEMIHIWRRTRDTGSVLSSEVDLRFYSSQDSVETSNQRHPNDHHSNISRRMVVEKPVAEQDETGLSALPTGASAHPQGHHPSDYSRLLLETRMMVDSLTNNFSALQSRLDGETSRSLVLQGEINKLRHILKNLGGKTADRNSRETINELPANQMNVESSVSLLTVKPSDKTDIRSESILEEPSEETLDDSSPLVRREVAGSAIHEERDEACNDSASITVNIYTVEDVPHSFPFSKAQDSNTLVQSSQKVLEGKMQLLQQENEVIKKQNEELKRKLKEISQELEKYICWRNSSDTEPSEEGREREALTDQVCNLKLELDYLKKSARSQEETLATKNSLMQDDYTKILLSLEEWCNSAAVIIREIQNAKSRLCESKISLELNIETEMIRDPKILSEFLSTYIQETTKLLLKTKGPEKNENLLPQDLKKGLDVMQEMGQLEQVISGYSTFIEECRKGKVSENSEKKVLDDYFAVIIEKASLMEEIKILKTENEMLCESQMEHYEKLKKTLIALKDRKNEVTALESTQKLSEEEKSKMAAILQVYEEGKKRLEIENSVREERIQELMAEMGRRDLHIEDCNEKLQAAVHKLMSSQKSSQLKERLIKELQVENNHLLDGERAKDNQIEMLKNELHQVQLRVAPLESELTSTKLFLNESEKEMAVYVSHLESVINNTQDSLDKVKQKLKESNQTICRLRKENDVFEQQHQCDLKLYHKTKDELESCKKQALNLENILKETEEERERLQKNVESLAASEKKKAEGLELLEKEYKRISERNASLTEKLEAFSEDKDQSLKVHKDLINKYAMLTKEVQKLQEKYRRVKTECNERTDLIRYLEMMLKENLLEYNDRIASLEGNISLIIEKLMKWKDCIREKHVGVNEEVRQLRHQLNTTNQERKELEDVVGNFHSLMKDLKSEILERERKVNELHVMLTLEQQKAADYENARKSLQDLGESPGKSLETLKIFKLKRYIEKMESELLDCRRDLLQCQTNYEGEKKRLELTIADQKSEISRYQLRIEVMMKNLSNYSKNMNTSSTDKSNADVANIQAMKRKSEEKDRKIAALCETVQKHNTELRMKDAEIENSKRKTYSLEEEVKNLRETLFVKNRSHEKQLKERGGMSEKLLESIKLVMEERAARQASEMLAVEKEKTLKDQIDQMKNEMSLKVKECESLSMELQDKKKSVEKLEDDLTKIKAEVTSLKAQVSTYKKRQSYKGQDDNCQGQRPPVSISPSPSSDARRLEVCLKELKEVRDMNLHLRKAEGQCQTKIIALEDQLREAKFRIKKLEGDVETQRK